MSNDTVLAEKDIALKEQLAATVKRNSYLTKRWFPVLA